MYNDSVMTEKLMDMLSGKELKYDPENRFLIKLGDEYFGAIKYVSLLGPDMAPIGLTMLSKINGNLCHITGINQPYVVIDPETDLNEENFVDNILGKTKTKEEPVAVPMSQLNPLGYQ